MARNGSGTYSLPSGNPVVSGTTISSTDFNNTMNDIATALTGSVAKNGETPWTGNMSAGSHRITGLGAATAVTDAAQAKQVQNSSYIYLTSVAGTNTVTGTSTPAPSAYATGQMFILTPANANTDATTVNVSSLGAKDLYANGAACAGGELADGVPVLICYNGTQFDIVTTYIATAKPTKLDKDGDYTVTAANVAASSCVVIVDASGGSVDITCPSVSDLDGGILTVQLGTDPGTNNVEVYESDGSTEIWTGVEVGDYVTLTSDGTNYQVIAHYEGHYCRVYMSSDQTISQGTSSQLTNWSETADTGGIFASNAMTAPFDCWAEIDFNLMANGATFVATLKQDTTYIRDPSSVSGGSNYSNQGLYNISVRLLVTSGQTIQMWAKNANTDSGNQVVMGDANADETLCTMKLTRAY